MTSRTLALSAPHLLAEYVRQTELQGFFEKRFAAPPDHVAILIRNGEVVDAFKGAHFSIGGVFNRIKALAVGSSHVRILLGDLKPFSVQAPVKALSKDKVEIAGVVTLELQVNPDAPKNVLGLVNPSGYVTRDEVLQRFRPHLTDRVFEAVVGRINADEVRGDRGLQDKLQGDVMREIERVAGDIGLIVRAQSVEWAINQVEREAMRRADMNRAQVGLDHDLDLLRRNLSRSGDAAEVQIKANLDLTRLQIDTDDEIARLTLKREVEFLDTREEAQRRQELAALAHEIETLSTERAARFENELAEAGQEIDKTRYQRALTRVHLEIDGLKQAHLAEMKKLGAFTDLEIGRRQQELDLEISERAQKQSRDHIAGLAALDRDTEEHAARLRETAEEGKRRRDIAAIEAEAAARVAQLKAGATMSPEQILAINAGLSADVAAVLVEQARAQTTGSDQTMAIMRDMVAAATEARIASEAQARDMFRMGMDGAVGVARGAGGRPGGVAGSVGTDPDNTVECSSCGRESAAKAKFCVGCGNKLRS